MKRCGKKNVLCLAKFVHLQDIFKLRSCYFSAKKDTCVIAPVE